MRPRTIPVHLLLVGAILAAAGCESGTTPQYVKSVNVIPGAIFTVVGDSVAVDVEVLGPDGESYPDRISRVEWSIGNPSVASLDVRESGVMVTGLELGTTQVTAELGRGTGTARIFVEPPGLDRVTIEPDPINLGPGASILVWVRLWDADGNPISSAPYHIEWFAVDTNIAYVLYRDANPTTLRTRSRGQTGLKVTVGGKSATTFITVN